MLQRSTIVVRALALAIATELTSAPHPALAQNGARPVRLDDLYAEERLSLAKDWSFSRDGAVAFVIERAPNTRKSWRVKGADVWVQLAAGQRPTNITDGVSDGSDWRDPIWSPDGRKLVMASTRSGTRSLWLWDRATKKLRAIGDRSLGNGGADGTSEGFYDWVDDDNLVAAVHPPGVRPPVPGTEEPGPMVAAKAGWAKFLAGETSVSVIETGVPDSVAKRSSVAATTAPRQESKQLVRIATATAATTVIADTYRPALFGLFKPELSPDGRFVFALVYGPPVSTASNDIGGTANLVIARVDAQPLKLNESLPGDVLWGTPRFSPDGKQLAYFAFGTSRQNTPKLVRVDLERGQVSTRNLGTIIPTHIRDDNWDFQRIEWTENGQLAVRAGVGEQATKKFARRDWWLLSESGEPRNVTEKMATVPAFERLSSNGPLVGVADGVLWKLDAVQGQVVPLTDRATRVAGELVWPTTDKRAFLWAIGRSYIVHREDRPTNGTVVVAAVDSATGRRRWTKVEVATGKSTALTPPDPKATLVKLGVEGATTYWADDARQNASSFWRIDAGGTTDRVVSLNGWRNSIITPRDTVIRYTSLYGEAYTGWILLPVNYQPGRRYPMIVHVYPGQTPRADPGDALYRIATAAGYAVMSPQMGTPNGRHFSAISKDIYFDVTNGVLPAIEKAVELGIADPSRLFVEGASGGGFATYTLIQQTGRFRAALASVGVSSWMNGSFSSGGRYGEEVSQLGIGWMGENVQDRPAVETMWSDLALYFRNSPIVYADRIQTPILIVHSDQDDNVPLSHSEEMFSALVQLKKRATFVRYWGEGHGFLNPANVRDLWTRRLAWYDEFGDIARDARGQLIFEGDRVKSRGAPALVPADYLRFDLFLKGGRGTGSN